jgi:hypothetical protein
MDELQGLIELLQLQTGSSVIDLRYRPDEDEPPWAVIIDWGDKYTAVVPGSIQENPIASLKAALRHLENQKAENTVKKVPRGGVFQD